ncbi:RDD family protein [Mycobacterium hodleri]|uniref:RDD family protein n=1 Tax=Mycolicibacterium hodleri TaxID=49897 RepID=UPI0021F2F4BF|nr:RDD family protein [Mycolicibacterium hodleri]MCV7132563.1 RDD family protein [Mycolicibacterium hodleri]
MTNPPPPPGGGYVPPPPGGGYVQRGGSAADGGRGALQYTPWLTRVLAWLVDWVPVAILSGIGSIVLFTMQNVESACIVDDSGYQIGDFCPTGTNGPTGAAWAVYAVLEVVAVLYVIWNLGVKQGRTGSSIGKRVMKFKVVGEDTGQPVGVSKSLLREVVYVVAYALCFVPWLVAVLFPLWDPKGQSLVDKVVKTVCVPI